MLNALIIMDDNKFKELESLLLTDFFVDYVNKLKSDIQYVSRLEFNYDVFFLLRDPNYDEIPAVNRLIKNKVFIYQTTNPDNLITSNKNSVPVYDFEFNFEDAIILKSSNMVGKAKYFKGVEEIVVFNPFHVDLNWEVVLNGNETTMAMVGDLALRSGKDVIIGQRNRNFVFFSCDVLSDRALSLGDNNKFIVNLLKDLLGGAEVVE